MKSVKLAVLVLVLALIATAAFANGKVEPLGTEENPIVWSFVPSGEMERVSAGAQEIADMLFDKTGYYFDTNVATEYVGVIEALSTDPPKAHMTSLATFAYIMAADRGVAKAALVSVRFGSSTYNGQIFVRTDSGITSISDLAGKSFARPDPLSTSGWIIPMITLKAAGVDPDTGLSNILDAGSHDGVVAAVYNGDADAGATYVDARTRVEDDFPDVMEAITIIEVTVDIPNDGVQFHPDMDAEMRANIVKALLEIAATEKGKEALDVAYQWAALEEQSDAFYDPFRQLLQASGINVEDLLK
jgi:phosphonate transport system substrate-binding protein